MSLSSEWNSLHNLALSYKVSYIWAHYVIRHLFSFLHYPTSLGTGERLSSFGGPLRMSTPLKEYGFAGFEYVVIQFVDTTVSVSLGHGIRIEPGN